MDNVTNFFNSGILPLLAEIMKKITSHFQMGLTQGDIYHIHGCILFILLIRLVLQSYLYKITTEMMH